MNASLSFMSDESGLACRARSIKQGEEFAAFAGNSRRTVLSFLGLEISQVDAFQASSGIQARHIGMR